jgi:chaperonin GroEL
MKERRLQDRDALDKLYDELIALRQQIAKNAGLEGEVVAEKCRHQQYGFGYNAATDTYEDLVLNGVLDPAKVTINAIENAASIAALVLTTEVLITELPKKEDKLVAPDPNYM